MDAQAISELVALVRWEIESSSRQTLEAATRGLSEVGKARAGDPGALDAIEAALTDIVAIASFDEALVPHLQLIADTARGAPGSPEGRPSRPSDPGRARD